MKILGIESTCDETAASVVENGSVILSNVIASQAKLHEEFGGVVPEIACRKHIEVIGPVVFRALKEAKLSWKEIDLISVSNGPGLIGAILIGLNYAKGLSVATGIPLMGINHIEAHLFAAIMAQTKPLQFPLLGCVLSGGHTAIVKIESIGAYTLLGETIDDAIGEAFDKVAKMMGLGYPGGPLIEELAREGNPYKYPLKAGKVKANPMAFSFSGLKTAVLYSLGGQNANTALTSSLPNQVKADMAASFQRAAFTDVIQKIQIASKETGISTVLFGGGVTNSRTFRKKIAEEAPEVTAFFPEFSLSLDNAAMIAGLAYHKYQERGRKADPLNLEASCKLSLHSS